FIDLCADAARQKRSRDVGAPTRERFNGSVRHRAVETGDNNGLSAGKTFCDGLVGFVPEQLSFAVESNDFGRINKLTAEQRSRDSSVQILAAARRKIRGG